MVDSFLALFVFLYFTVTLILQLPAFFPVTFPFFVTVATDFFVDLNFFYLIRLPFTLMVFVFPFATVIFLSFSLGADAPSDSIAGTPPKTRAKVKVAANIICLSFFIVFSIPHYRAPCSCADKYQFVQARWCLSGLCYKKLLCETIVSHSSYQLQSFALKTPT